MAIPGASGDEALVAAKVREELLAVGVPHEAISHDTAHQRGPIAESTTGNLIVSLLGNRPGARRMLMAHMDTVPICVGARPQLQDGMLVSQDAHTGLGADDRAGVATVLFAATEILAQNMAHGPLTLLFTVQEEIGLKGARHLEVDKLGKPDLAFNWDGGNPAKLTIGAIGGYRMTIDIHGLASHAGVAPERGVSAITVAGIAINDLHQQGLLGKISQDGFEGTSNIGVIQGGNATNVVADHVQLRAEIRSHNEATIEVLAQRFEQAFRSAVTQVRNNSDQVASVEINGDLNYQPFAMSAEVPSVQVASDALTQLGIDPMLAIANGGLDANWLYRHGISVVSLGCGQHNQHMTSEMLDVDQFHTACEVALRIASGKDSGE
ncbi:M20/M25/M40 family metallo-hydrolase [Bremerella sp. JC770]|uniref:M20/M25/M40 family metallo-hydrolase n=1 Tax=Bremerella sp. JC770 TaxID=3232137 RepID=UPI0034593AE1